MNISLNSNVTYKSIKKGELLFRENEPCEYFYILCSGSICIFKESNNRIIPFHVHTKNELIGEESVFKGHYLYNATALEDSELAILESNDLNKYLDANSLWIKNILNEISTRISSSISSLVEHKIVDNELFEGDFSIEYEKLLSQSLKS